MTLIFESPQEQFHAPTPITKEAAERLQLERLRTDYLLRGSGLQLAAVERGNEPPDFVAEGPEGPYGLDLTRFSITARMTAQALFRRLRSAMLGQPRERFAHLTGSTVYLWFDDKGFSSLPPKPGDAVDALLEALADYEFDPTLTVHQVRNGQFPDPIGDIGTADSGAGAHFYAIPMVNGTPSSFFYMTTGFELGLAFQTEHDTQGAWADISRLVDSHDKPEIQSLVITVGAPDRNGLSYPSEQGLMEFALERNGPDIKPQHLHDVLVHFWGDGRVVRIYPQLSCVAGPLYYGGFIPAHFSIVPLPVGVSPEIAEGQSDIATDAANGV